MIQCVFKQESIGSKQHTLKQRIRLDPTQKKHLWFLYPRMEHYSSVRRLFGFAVAEFSPYKNVATSWKWVHRITESGFALEGPFRDHLVQPPCLGQGQIL